MGNRNNNGSLFHQLINAPGLMERQDLSQPVSFQTKENYFNWCHKAAGVFKSYGIRNLSDIGKDEIQRYENQLEAEGKSGLNDSQLSRANLQGHWYRNQRYSQADSCIQRVQAQRW